MSYGFTKDLSTENPALHRLYVSYAQEELKIISKFMEELNSLSRVNPSILAGKVWQEQAELLKTDVAYREALWRIEAGDELNLDTIKGSDGVK
jgi:hypothetical protein